MAGRHRSEHGQAQRAPDLRGGVQQPRCQARILRRDIRHSQHRQRRERQPAADPHEDHGEEEVSKVVAVLWRADQQDQRQPNQDPTRQQHPLGTKAHDQPRGPISGQPSHGDGDGQEGQTDGHRAEVQNALQIQRSHEEHAKHSDDHQALHEIRNRQCAGPEEPQGKDWIADRGLPRNERDQEYQRHATESQGVKRGKAEGVGLDDRVDTQHQRSGHQEGSEQVGALAKPEREVALNEPRGEGGGRHANGKVDKEDPVPANRLGEQAASEESHRCASRGDEGEDAHRTGPIGGLRKHRHDHPEDDGRAHGAADALEKPRADQHRLAERQPAQQ